MSILVFCVRNYTLNKCKCARTIKLNVSTLSRDVGSHLDSKSDTDTEQNAADDEHGDVYGGGDDDDSNDVA